MTSRILTTLLILPLLAGVAACSDDDETPSAPAPIATTASPAPPEPVVTGTAELSPVGGDTSEARLCAKADAGRKTFTAALAKSVDGSGKIPPAAAKKAFGDLAASLNAIAATGRAGGPVTSSMTAFADEVTRVAGEPDPFASSEDPAFEKAGDALDASCKAAK